MMICWKLQRNNDEDTSIGWRVMMMYRFRKIYYPEIFQGKYKTKHYFEGWYYKIIDKSMVHAIAVIPGISIGRDLTDSHAFIQILTNENQVECFRFPLSEFSFCEKEFAVRIADNFFSRDKLRLKLKGKNFSISGRLEFTNIAELPKSLIMPGIMGPYTYAPFMECYHGIINIHHLMIGSLKISERTIDFTDGYGYIEKDWGKSFPKTWVWLQSNHFGNEDITLMFSAARIPWLGGAFPGFLSFLRIKEQIYLFASYTGAKLRKISYHNGWLKILLVDKHHRLTLEAFHKEGGALQAPENGLMTRRISESINSEVSVHLTDQEGNLIYQGKGTNTGIEIVI